MKRIGFALALATSIASSPAFATATVSDPVGDFIPSFTGTKSADLDVTSFSVSLNSAGTLFSLGAVLAGDINPAIPGFYVIGVDTGAGAIKPFAGIGEPNVIFDQVILVQKNGTATVGPNSLSVFLSGNQFIVQVPVSFLPSTGSTPANYGFNIWPRDPNAPGGGNFQISDFAPNNALLSEHGVLPEPGTWALMLLGFGLIGAVLRYRRDPKESLAQLA